MTLYDYKQKPIFTGIQKSYLFITWDGQNVLSNFSVSGQFPRRARSGQVEDESERKMWLFYPDQIAFLLFLWLTADWLEMWAEKRYI